MIEIGIKGITDAVVCEKNTAKAMGSGTLEVFATPAMIALMEETASKSVADYLDEGFTTVGTLINVKHLAASPLGMKISCESQLVEADGRRLVFKVFACDEKERIGEGMHERFIVKTDKFLDKAKNKMQG